jgi:hypothetical protein
MTTVDDYCKGKCRTAIVLWVMGKCLTPGCCEQTSSKSYKYCHKCATHLDVCNYCGKQLFHSNKEKVKNQPLNGQCPGLSNVQGTYCKWYVCAIDPDYTKYTICEYCYNSGSVGFKTEHVECPELQKALSINCDIDSAISSCPKNLTNDVE